MEDIQICTAGSIIGEDVCQFPLCTRTRHVAIFFFFFFEDHSDQTKQVICMNPWGEQPEFLKEGAIILNE